MEQCNLFGKFIDETSDNVSFRTLFTTTNCQHGHWTILLSFGFFSVSSRLEHSFFPSSSLCHETCQAVKATILFLFSFVFVSKFIYEKSGGLGHIFDSWNEEHLLCWTFDSNSSSSSSSSNFIHAKHFGIQYVVSVFLFGDRLFYHFNEREKKKWFFLRFGVLT